MYEYMYEFNREYAMKLPSKTQCRNIETFLPTYLGIDNICERLSYFLTPFLILLDIGPDTIGGP